MKTVKALLAGSAALGWVGLILLAAASPSFGGGRLEGFALHEAVLAKDAAAVVRLLDGGAPVNHHGQGEMTALHLAAAVNWPEGAELLLDRGADPNARERYGWTPLHQAARTGAQRVARLLLDNGADANARDDRARLTPLHRAAQAGHAEVVELLLKRGAEVDARSAGRPAADMTPLHWAASGHSEGNARAIELLLQAGADANAADSRQLTALHWAALADQPRSVALLGKAGASPYALDDRGESVLVFASRSSGAVRRELAKFVEPATGIEDFEGYPLGQNWKTAPPPTWSFSWRLRQDRNSEVAVAQDPADEGNQVLRVATSDVYSALTREWWGAELKGDFGATLDFYIEKMEGGRMDFRLLGAPNSTAAIRLYANGSIEAWNVDTARRSVAPAGEGFRAGRWYRAVWDFHIPQDAPGDRWFEASVFEVAEGGNLGAQVGATVRKPLSDAGQAYINSLYIFVRYDPAKVFYLDNIRIVRKDDEGQ